MVTKSPLNSPVARPLPAGIKKTKIGYRVFVRVHQGAGGLKSKRYKGKPPLKEMTDWQADTRSAWRTRSRQPEILKPAPATPPTFPADAERYLEAVRAMPSIADRKQHIREWVAIIGDRPTASITSTEIRTQRDRWLTVGPKRRFKQHEGQWQWVPMKEPLAPGSVNRRLRALENLFTVLDPNGPNPVRDVPECEEPGPQARGVTFAIILEVLQHMPDHGQGVKDEARAKHSKTKARLAVMLWTGLAHSQVAKLTEEDIDDASMTYLRPRRRKGRKGSRNRSQQHERPRPLLPQAGSALKHFFAIGANGPFSRSSVYKSWRRGILLANEARLKTHRDAGLAGKPLLIPEALRPYDVKHTFGGEAYRASKDIRAVQELLGLSRLELADRYAHTAVAPAAAEAAAKLAEAAPKT